jgi:hypothetical protein
MQTTLYACKLYIIIIVIIITIVYGCMTHNNPSRACDIKLFVDGMAQPLSLPVATPIPPGFTTHVPPTPTYVHQSCFVVVVGCCALTQTFRCVLAPRQCRRRPHQQLISLPHVPFTIPIVMHV